MSRRWLLLPVLFVVAGIAAEAGAQDPEISEPAIIEEEIFIGVTADVEDFELGEPLRITVVRVWSKELEPEAWSDDLLAPLEFRALETSTRDDSLRVEETRHFELDTFRLEDIEIPDTVFRATSRADGSPVITIGDGFTILIRPTVDREDPGSAELPEGGVLLPEPPSGPEWWRLGAAALSFLGAALLAVFLRHRARQRELAAARDSAELPAGPAATALERLRRLRELDPNESEELESYFIEASAVLREYVGERFAVRTRERTTEELSVAPEVAHQLDTTHRDLMSDYLARCDGVKFGRRTVTREVREGLLDSAERFVNETRNGDTAPRPPEEDLP